MSQDTSEAGIRAEARPGGAASLGTRLILANAIITILAVAALGYYVYYRTQQSSASLADQLEANVRQQAQNELAANGDEQVASLNGFFTTVRRDITDAGASAEALLSKESYLGGSLYWNAADSLTRTSKGSWDNVAAGDPASVFMPSKTSLTDSLVQELNTLKQLDFVIPQKLKANPDAVAVYFGGPAGETLYYPDIDLANVVPADFDVTQRPWYVKAAPEENPERGAVWSDPYLDAALHGLVVTSSVPVFDSGGVFRGVIAMDIQLGRISDLVSNIHAGKTGYAFLIDRDKRLIALSPAAYIDLGVTPEQLPLGASLDPGQLPTALPADFTNLLANMSGGQSGLATITLGNTERFVLYRPVPDVDYSIGIVVPSSELLEGVIGAREQLAEASTNTTQFSLALVAVILALAMLATVLLSRGLIAPLRALTATAREITAGDLDARAEVKSRDEIGSLSQTLNTMTENFQQLVQSLEGRVRERTAALELASRDAARRAAQFEAITRVTAAIGTIRNLDELLPLVSTVISEQFGYYHVGIFVNDKGSGSTYLIAANSDGGQKMLHRRHSLKIGEQGIVGFVAARGEPRVAHHVGEDAVFFDNPDLPLTKSEAALPLRSATEITGVLDVQSTEEDAFSPDDVRILGVLANHVSLAFENAQLFEATRRSLSEAETLYRQYVREAWRGAPGDKPVAGYRFTPQGSFPLAVDELPRMASDRGAEEGAASGATLTIPIELRGEIIGELVIGGGDGTPWTQEQIDLAHAVAERVALSAENARLFEETGRRAERERLVTEITSKIRLSNDPREMMQTALEELRNALGATKVQVIPQTVSPMETRPEPRPPSGERAAASEPPPRNGAQE